MKFTQKNIFIVVIIVLVVGVFITVSIGGNKGSTGPGKYDAFATCLKDKGALFYGAFWCPHCQNQKKAFGSSEKFLPYVECSTPDGGAQTQVCIDKKITGYPTWEFADGSRMNGEIPMETLAQKTGCVLPQ